MKLKSLLLQKDGVTNEGLDCFLPLGMVESSRSLRNQKDFFAGIASQVVKTSAKNFPYQSTIDNLDLKIDQTLHHLTMEFIEVEQFCTKHLDRDKKAFGDTIKLFDKDTLLLTSDTNKELLKHFNKVVAISVGRALAERVPGAKFLKRLFKNHHDHPTSDLERKPATLFVKKPQYLHEMKNIENHSTCMR